MQIAGKEIEIKEIIDYAVTKAGEKGNYQYQAMDFARLQVDTSIRSFAWSRILGELGAFTDNGKAVNAEAAVAALIHAGLDKKDLKYKNNTYKIRMPNFSYRVTREKTGFGAETGVGRECRIHGLSAEDFADLVVKFDTLASDIHEAGEGLFKELMKKLEDERRKEMALQLAMTTVESILSEFIKPLGIEYSTSIHGDRVSVHMTQTKEADFELPISELAEKMKDTESVLASMKTVSGSQSDDDGHYFRRRFPFSI